MNSGNKRLSIPEYSAMLRDAIRKFIGLLEENRANILAPELKGRWIKKQGSFFHPCTEIFFQLNGSCRFEFPAQEIFIKPGDILFVLPGMPHRETATDEKFRNLVYQIGNTEAMLHLAEAPGPVSVMPAEAGVPYPVYRECLKTDDFYPALHKALSLFSGDGSPDTEAFRKHLLSAMLLHSFRELGPPQTSKASSHGIISAYDSGNYKVNMAVKIIHEHVFSPPPAVAEIAAAVKCSPNHLSTLFHRYAGTTIKQYCNNLKLEYARRQIKNPAYNISEIAWNYGFRDTSYFIKIFKKRFGYSPGKLRSALSGTD